MAQLAGHFVQVDIDGVPYTVSEWSFDDNCPALDTTNSEGVDGSGAPNVVAFATNTSGVAQATIMLKTATFDDTDDIFAPPLILRSGLVVRILIYLDGRAAANPHVFPRVRITNVKDEGQTTGLQPITLEGVTDGVYFLRGQTGTPRILTARL
jgi:hypothetical protein